ncbi:MAG TPA: TonB-dependent receptor, partial [Thermoanaerobaculia bacterium]|nr:TonB-dependent receptor [Thermoanaerobaculia bacterium]
SAKVMERLPLGRNYAAVVRLQPGVQEDTGDRQGRGMALSVYGSTSAENQFVIDGVNTNSVVRGVQGKIINTEFIQEVEVKTGGYQAEYGRATGGIINVITKSGGNEFHGDVFANYAPKSFRSEQQFKANDALLDDGGVAARFGTFDNVKTTDYGADLGGYFIQDRLWFFTAYNYSDGERDRVPKSPSSQFFGVYNQGFKEEIRYNLFSGKLTWNIAQGSTLVGTYFRDPEHHDGAIFTPISTNVDESFGRRDIGSQDYSARFNQLFGSVGVLTLQYAKHNDRYLFKPLHPDIIGVQDRTHPHDYPNFPYIQGFGQVPGYRLNNEGKRDEYIGSFTAYLGNHEFKVGGDYTKNVTTDVSFFTGGQRPRVRLCSSNPASASYCPPGEGDHITNFYGEPVRVYYQHDFYAPTLGSFTILDESVASPPTKAYSAFAQDTWRITPRLSLNAGVRLDIQKVKNKRDETTIDLNKEWQPRVGLVYDWMGDGSTKLFGSYGRFYYMIPNDLNVRKYGDQFQTSTFNYSITDTRPGGPGVAGPPNRETLVQGATAEPTEPGIGGQYQDEFTLGAEKALTPTFAVGLKGMYRKLGRVIEDRCDLDYLDPVNQDSSCAIINPGSGGFWDGGPNSTFGWCDAAESEFTSPTAGECFAGGAPKVPKATRTFKGIELTARKTFTQSAWLQFSYIYSTLRGNYDGAVRVASGQTDPGINADYDYPLFLKNADGRLYLDRPHQLRLDALYTAPFGLSVGFGTYLRSGAPVSRAGYYNSFYPDLLHLVKRGEDDAIYVGARLPFEYEANLSLGYTLKVGPVSITPSVYVFNVLNRQGIIKIDERFNPDGTFCEEAAGCTPSNTPDYSQKNFERLGTLHLGDPLPQDNWGAPQLRQLPREVRVGLKVSF